MEECDAEEIADEILAYEALESGLIAEDLEYVE